MNRLTSAISTAAIAAMIGLTSLGNVAAAPNVPAKAELSSDLHEAQYRRHRHYDEDDDYGWREHRRDRWRRQHARRWDNDGYRERRYGDHRRHNRPRFEFYID